MLLSRNLLNGGAFALGIVGMLMIAGCGTPQAGMPGSQSSSPAANIAGQNLLYSATGGPVLVFSYPGGKPVATIERAFSGGVCSDAKGNVFVVDPSYSQIDEYPHGSFFPSAVLGVNAEPTYCAIDPNTDDLAVTVDGLRGPGVAVFTGEKERPKYFYYNSRNQFLESCAYDGDSNLFIDASPGFTLTELPKNGRKVIALALGSPYQFSDDDPIGWDGEHIAVGNATSDGETIYRFAVKGRVASIVGKTILKGASGGTMWIHNGTILTNASYNYAGIWNYPAGGRPKRTIKGAEGALTVSFAPQ